MAIADFSSVGSKLTKKIFEGDIVRQMSEETHLLDHVRKTSIQLGTDVTNVVEVMTPQGIGSRADRAALPTAGNTTLANPVWDTIQQYIRIAITGKTWRRTQGNVRAFAPALANAVKEAILAYNRELEWQLSADGTGKRFLLLAAVAQGQNVTLTSAAGYNVRGMFEGMKIDVDDANGNPLLSGATVTAVDRVNLTVTVDDTQGVDLPINGIVYRAGNKAIGEIFGLNYLVNDATHGNAIVLGLSSTPAWWQSTVLANGGTARAMTRALLDQAYVTSESANGKPPTIVTCDYIQYQNLLAMHTRPEIFANGSGKGMTLDLHNKVAIYGEATVVRTNMGEPGVVVFGQSENFEMKENTKLDWIYEPDGKNIWHYTPGFDEYEAVAIHDAQFILRRRNLHVRVQDLNLTAPV
jgi:hypothetical protein